MKYIVPLLMLAGVLSACSNNDDERRNQAPSVTAPAAQSVENTGAPISVDFNVRDDRDSLSVLTIEVTSDNDSLFPAENISISNAGSTVTVTLTPTQTLGTASINLNVVDTEGLSASASSSVEITAESIEFNALARRVFEQAPNSEPQNLDILNIQEGNPSDDFADLL